MVLSAKKKAEAAKAVKPVKAAKAAKKCAPPLKENTLSLKKVFEMKKRVEKVIKLEAAKELLRRQELNDGKTKYGDSSEIVNIFNVLGYDFVTKSKIHHLALLVRNQENKALKKSGKKPLSHFAGGDSESDDESMSSTSSSSSEESNVSVNEKEGSEKKKPSKKSQVKGSKQTPQSKTAKRAQFEPYSTAAIQNALNTNGPEKEGQTDGETIVRAKGGRPKGTTGIKQKPKPLPPKAERDEAARISQLTEKAARLYAVEKQKARESGISVPNGTLKTIVRAIEQESSLAENTIKTQTVLSRITKNNLSGYVAQQRSPLEDMEPLIVEYCVKLAKMGQPLCKDQVVSLATVLIKGTEAETRLIAFKKKRMLLDNNDPTAPIIGVQWFNGFTKRHIETITIECGGALNSLSRHFQLRLENYKTMYNIVYDAMVSAGVAEKLYSLTLFDIEGKKLANSHRDSACGLPSQYKLLKPSYVLLVDEVGSKSRSMENFYNHIDGQAFKLNVDRTSTGIGQSIEMHFSVYCFHSGTGEAVLCAIIFKTEQKVEDLPLSVRYGIDIFTPLEEGQTELELYERNCSHGQAMEGGPCCYFMGKEMPCFVGTSTTGKLNSDLLLDILKHLDSIQLYDRSDNTNPVLLMDGHNSRFDLPLIHYVEDDAHKWTLCCGLLHGSHLVQIADARDFNKKFTKGLDDAEDRLLTRKPADRQKFYPSDIVPLITQAWSWSFARPELAKKTIALRGWNPLNYALLLHPVLHKNSKQATTPE